MVVQEEGWVVCRVFKKRVATVRRMADGAPWFDDHVAGGFMPDLIGSPRQLMHHPNAAAAVYSGGQQQLYHCKPELEYHHLLPSQDAFLQQLPQLESPKPPPAYIAAQGSCSLQSPDEASGYAAQQPPLMEAAYMDDSVTDWRVLDKFVASQLFSHGDGTAKEAGYPSPAPAFQAENKQPEGALDYASTSASGGGEASMWK
jgi:hypothetical protein